MFRTIKYDEIDSNEFDKDYILIDVRSPGEYNTATIPGAINIPIFDNKEREEIGKAYIQKNTDEAKKLGIDAAARRLPEIYDKISELNKKHDKLILFCSRGGFRSSSLVSLLMTIGINIYKVDKGYKGYRQYINKYLPKVSEDVKFIILYGNTGTGKTDILKNLMVKDMDVLDLEGCANHRGSTLGGVGLGPQSSQKMFESLIYDSLRNRKTNTVFVEGESRKIGQTIIPKYIYDSMGKGVNLNIYADIDTRVNNISTDYVDGTDTELISSLNYLRNQLGHKVIDKYINMINHQEHEIVIKELMIDYYDPRYEYKDRKYVTSFENINSGDTADNIIRWIKD